MALLVVATFVGVAALVVGLGYLASRSVENGNERTAIINRWIVAAWVVIGLGVVAGIRTIFWLAA